VRAATCQHDSTVCVQAYVCGAICKACWSSEPAHPSVSFSPNEFCLWITYLFCFYVVGEGNKGLGGRIEKVLFPLAVVQVYKHKIIGLGWKGPLKVI